MEVHKVHKEGSQRTNNNAAHDIFGTMTVIKLQVILIILQKQCDCPR